MTDTERIEQGSDDGIVGLDETPDAWDEYAGDAEAEDKYEDFLDWLNEQA